ncbi:MAG TPA: GT4 family glycosyltransferase PelF [Candidatus Binatia bacterium]
MHDKIKLFTFLNCFDIGGTERHVVSLARRLDAATFELNLGCMYKTGPFLKDIERLHIPVAEYTVRTLRSHRFIKEQIRCAADMRRNHIQLVHTYGFYPNVFAIPAARLARVPIVIASIRDTLTLDLSPMRCRAQQFVCRLADCILVNATAIRRRLISEGYNRDKIHVIKNGIDLSRFVRRPDNSGLRSEFGLSPSTPLVIVLSRLSKIKGIEYFLEAAAILAQRFDDARFLIVGDLKDDPAYRAQLERLAIDLGVGQRVIFTGFRLDVAELLSEANVSVLPSLTEGLSNTLLESMAAGLPVVATNVGGNSEIVEDGITGFLVPPKDPGALAQSISALLANRETARRFGEAGRERVAQHFSLERMVAATEDLYLRLLGKASGRRTAAPRTQRSWREPWGSRKPLPLSE